MGKESFAEDREYVCFFKWSFTFTRVWVLSRISEKVKLSLENCFLTGLFRVSTKLRPVFGSRNHLDCLNNEIMSGDV